jgi:hypothetical protein
MKQKPALRLLNGQARYNPTILRTAAWACFLKFFGSLQSAPSCSIRDFQETNRGGSFYCTTAKAA